MKYIDADKLTTIVEERKAQQDQWINRYHDPINQGLSQELTEILSIITSLQQEQPEVEFEDVEYLLDKVKYMSGYWVKTNPDCAKIIRDFNNRLNARKEE